MFSATTISDSCVQEAAEPGWADETVLAVDTTEQTGFMAMERVIKEGKAIIDVGATGSLGSEEVVQQIANLNWARAGEDGIEIIPDGHNNGRHSCTGNCLGEASFRPEPWEDEGSPSQNSQTAYIPQRAESSCLGCGH